MHRPSIKLGLFLIILTATAFWINIGKCQTSEYKPAIVDSNDIYNNANNNYTNNAGSKTLGQVKTWHSIKRLLWNYNPYQDPHEYSPDNGLETWISEGVLDGDCNSKYHLCHSPVFSAKNEARNVQVINYRKGATILATKWFNTLGNENENTPNSYKRARRQTSSYRSAPRLRRPTHYSTNSADGPSAQNLYAKGNYNSDSPTPSPYAEITYEEDLEDGFEVSDISPQTFSRKDDLQRLSTGEMLQDQYLHKLYTFIHNNVVNLIGTRLHIPLTSNKGKDSRSSLSKSNSQSHNPFYGRKEIGGDNRHQTQWKSGDALSYIYGLREGSSNKEDQSKLTYIASIRKVPFPAENIPKGIASIEGKRDSNSKVAPKIEFTTFDFFKWSHIVLTHDSDILDINGDNKINSVLYPSKVRASQMYNLGLLYKNANDEIPSESTAPTINARTLLVLLQSTQTVVSYPNNAKPEELGKHIGFLMRQEKESYKTPFKQSQELYQIKETYMEIYQLISPNPTTAVTGRESFNGNTAEKSRLDLYRRRIMPSWNEQRTVTDFKIFTFTIGDSWSARQNISTPIGRYSGRQPDRQKYRASHKNERNLGDTTPDKTIAIISGTSHGMKEGTSTPTCSVGLYLWNEKIEDFTVINRNYELPNVADNTNTIDLNDPHKEVDESIKSAKLFTVPYTKHGGNRPAIHLLTIQESVIVEYTKENTKNYKTSHFKPATTRTYAIRIHSVNAESRISTNNVKHIQTLDYSSDPTEVYDIISYPTTRTTQYFGQSTETLLLIQDTDGLLHTFKWDGLAFVPFSTVNRGKDDPNSLVLQYTSLVPNLYVSSDKRVDNAGSDISSTDVRYAQYNGQSLLIALVKSEKDMDIDDNLDIEEDIRPPIGYKYSLDFQALTENILIKQPGGKSINPSAQQMKEVAGSVPITDQLSEISTNVRIAHMNVLQSKLYIVLESQNRRTPLNADFPDCIDDPFWILGVRKKCQTSQAFQIISLALEQKRPVDPITAKHLKLLTLLEIMEEKIDGIETQLSQAEQAMDDIFYLDKDIISVTPSKKSGSGQGETTALYPLANKTFQGSVSAQKGVISTNKDIHILQTLQIQSPIPTKRGHKNSASKPDESNNAPSTVLPGAAFDIRIVRRAEKVFANASQAYATWLANKDSVVSSEDKNVQFSPDITLQLSLSDDSRSEEESAEIRVAGNTHIVTRSGTGPLSPLRQLKMRPAIRLSAINGHRLRDLEANMLLPDPVNNTVVIDRPIIFESDITIKGDLQTDSINGIDLSESAIKTNKKLTLPHSVITVLKDVKVINNLQADNGINGIEIGRFLNLNQAFKEQRTIVFERLTVEGNLEIDSGTVNSVNLVDYFDNLVLLNSSTPQEISGAKEFISVDNMDIVFNKPVHIESELNGKHFDNLIKSIVRIRPEKKKKGTKTSHVVQIPISEVSFKNPVYIKGDLDIGGDVNRIAFDDYLRKRGPQTFTIPVTFERDVVLHTDLRLSPGVQAFGLGPLQNEQYIYNDERNIITIEATKIFEGQTIFDGPVKLNNPWADRETLLIDGVSPEFLRDIVTLYDESNNKITALDLSNDIEFSDVVTLDGSLITQSQFNGINLTEHFVTALKKSQITRKLRSKDSELHFTGTKMFYQDSSLQGDILSEIIVPSGLGTFTTNENIFFQKGVLVNGLILEQDLWLSHSAHNQKLPQTQIYANNSISFLGPVTFEGELTVENRLNDIDWPKFLNDRISLSRDQEIGSDGQGTATQLIFTGNVVMEQDLTFATNDITLNQDISPKTAFLYVDQQDMSSQKTTYVSEEDDEPDVTLGSSITLHGVKTFVASTKMSAGEPFTVLGKLLVLQNLNISSSPNIDKDRENGDSWLGSDINVMDCLERKLTLDGSENFDTTKLVEWPSVQNRPMSRKQNIKLEFENVRTLKDVNVDDLNGKNFDKWVANLVPLDTDQTFDIRDLGVSEATIRFDSLTVFRSQIELENGKFNDNFDLDQVIQDAWNVSLVSSDDDSFLFIEDIVFKDGFDIIADLEFASNDTYQALLNNEYLFEVNESYKLGRIVPVKSTTNDMEDVSTDYVRLLGKSADRDALAQISSKPQVIYGRKIMNNGFNINSIDKNQAAKLKINMINGIPFPHGFLRVRNDNSKLNQVHNQIYEPFHNAQDGTSPNKSPIVIKFTNTVKMHGRNNEIKPTHVRVNNQIDLNRLLETESSFQSSVDDNYRDSINSRKQKRVYRKDKIVFRGNVATKNLFSSDNLIDGTNLSSVLDRAILSTPSISHAPPIIVSGVKTFDSSNSLSRDNKITFNQNVRMDKPSQSVINGKTTFQKFERSLIPCYQPSLKSNKPKSIIIQSPLSLSGKMILSGNGGSNQPNIVFNVNRSKLPPHVMSYIGDIDENERSKSLVKIHKIYRNQSDNINNNNPISLSNLLENELIYLDKPVVLEAPITFHGKHFKIISPKANQPPILEIEGKLNGVSFDSSNILVTSFIPQNYPEDYKQNYTIPTRLHFDNLIIHNNVVAGDINENKDILLNGVSLSDFARSILKRSDIQDLSTFITAMLNDEGGKVTELVFEGEVHINANLIVSGSVNQMDDINALVVPISLPPKKVNDDDTDTMQIITAKQCFTRGSKLKLMGRENALKMGPDSSVFGVNLNELVTQIIPTQNKDGVVEIQVGDNVQFNGTISLESDLDISGKINDIELQDIITAIEEYNSLTRITREKSAADLDHQCERKGMIEQMAYEQVYKLSHFMNHWDLKNEQHSNPPPSSVKKPTLDLSLLTVSPSISNTHYVMVSRVNEYQHYNTHSQGQGAKSLASYVAYKQDISMETASYFEYCDRPTNMSSAASLTVNVWAVTAQDMNNSTQGIIKHYKTVVELNKGPGGPLVLKSHPLNKGMWKNIMYDQDESHDTTKYLSALIGCGPMRIFEFETSKDYSNQMDVELKHAYQNLINIQQIEFLVRVKPLHKKYDGSTGHQNSAIYVTSLSGGQNSLQEPLTVNVLSPKTFQYFKRKSIVVVLTEKFGNKNSHSISTRHGATRSIEIHEIDMTTFANILIIEGIGLAETSALSTHADETKTKLGSNVKSSEYGNKMSSRYQIGRTKKAPGNTNHHESTIDLSGFAIFTMIDTFKPLGGKDDVDNSLDTVPYYSSASNGTFLMAWSSDRSKQLTPKAWLYSLDLIERRFERIQIFLSYRYIDVEIISFITPQFYANPTVQLQSPAYSREPTHVQDTFIVLASERSLNVHHDYPTVDIEVYRNKNFGGVLDNTHPSQDNSRSFELLQNIQEEKVLDLSHFIIGSIPDIYFIVARWDNFIHLYHYKGILGFQLELISRSSAIKSIQPFFQGSDLYLAMFKSPKSHLLARNSIAKAVFIGNWINPINKRTCNLRDSI